MVGLCLLCIMFHTVLWYSINDGDAILADFILQYTMCYIAYFTMFLTLSHVQFCYFAIIITFHQTLNRVGEKCLLVDVLLTGRKQRITIYENNRSTGNYWGNIHFRLYLNKDNIQTQGQKKKWRAIHLQMSLAMQLCITIRNMYLYLNLKLIFLSAYCFLGSL